MSAFDRLHPALQHHIVNSLGWPALRPLQEMAIEPLLAGEAAILLAPTAGGKTEAALFPLLSRMMAEDWRGLTILYICPIKALLNNLEIRLSSYGALVGRHSAVWHGDVKAPARKRILGDPPDILLTTPESLEVILTMRPAEARLLFSSLRAVIVDEIHAFAGDDRGWHLLAVLGRIEKLTGRKLQRIGLSATVGNAKELLAWLAGGEAARVIDPGPATVVDTDVQIDYVGSIENAATVIARLHKGEKRLVFCDSRSRVEKLAALVRELGVEVYVSHSSVSLDERRRAEAAFAEGTDCVILATSTLELGIDVGDLDRVIQIDSPPTVSSFLQRLGRTGRRFGAKRNTLFLATNEDALLLAAAIVRLWERGYVEPIVPPPQPLHLVGQQLLALTLQEKGLAISEWSDWLGDLLRRARISVTDAKAVLDHMLSTGILAEDQGVLGLGDAGENRYGRKNFLELFSIFTTPLLFQVRYGRAALGEVEPLSFLAREGRKPVLLLAGRSWSVVEIDWPRRVVWVEPSDERGASRWMGGTRALSFVVCRAIRDVLVEEDISPRWSKRASTRLAEEREYFSWLDCDATTLVHDASGASRWWTFAGTAANASLADNMSPHLPHATGDDFGISFSGKVTAGELCRELDRLRAIETPLSPARDMDRMIEELKFGTCVPSRLLTVMIRQRMSDPYAANDLRESRVVSAFTQS